MIDPKVADSVLSRISERDLVELALHITNVESPPGEEGEGAEASTSGWPARASPPKRVGMFEDRFNVFAEVPGSGPRAGARLQRHIDTWMRRDDHLICARPGQRPDYHLGWEEGDTPDRQPGRQRQGPDGGVS